MLNMNHKLLSTLILASTAMVAQVASAYDGEIKFTGKVTSQTCKINGNGGGGKDFVVALPTVQASALFKAGEVAGRTPFNISLYECTPNSGKVRAYFEPGSTTDGGTGNLTLIGSAGNADKVQIGLLNADDFSPIKAGFAIDSQNSKWVSIADGNATFSYYAQYVATGAATPGAANSTVMYTIVYQ